MSPYNEPPENYMMDPPYCEDCEEEPCLIEIGKTCPAEEEWEEDQRVRIAQDRIEQAYDDAEDLEFDELYDKWVIEREEEREPTEQEKDFMRDMGIDFDEELTDKTIEQARAATGSLIEGPLDDDEFIEEREQ